MDIRLSRRAGDLPVSRLQWNALAAETPGSTVFQTNEWFECWWNSFGLDKELFCVTLWDGDSLVGIAPLMIFRRSGLRHLELVGSPNGDYQDFILGARADELLPELARFLLSQRRDWDMLVLRNLPMDSVTHRLFPDLMRSLGFDATDVERIACPTMKIASCPSETRELLGRYSTRRRIKAMQQAGGITFVRCTTPEQLEHYLPLFFDQYVDRRRGSSAADVFVRPEVRAFFESLSKALLPNGWLHFSVLECNGRPAAFHLGFEYGGRLYWYKPCFDPALARMSPGQVLMFSLIQDALDRGLDELDFTVGAEAFKYRFANAERTNANVRVFARRWLYMSFLGLAWARRTAGRLRRRLRR